MGGQRPTGAPGVAAAGYLADLLRGPRVSGEVVATRSDAALAIVWTGPNSRIIAIADTSAGATRTANTVLLSGAPRPTAGAIVRVGEGELQLAGHVHRIGRYWPSGVRAHPAHASAIDPAAIAGMTGAGTPGLPDARVLPLLTALATGSGLAAAARSLVGLGPGSTPAGDDVLAGVALALRVAARHDLLADLYAAVSPDLADRTTALSADLLRAALAGHASPEVLAALATLRPGSTPPARRRAVDAVLGLGHTSGADLLQGLAAALRVTSAEPGCSPHPGPPAQTGRMAVR